jgi:signal transduction histidine kinase
LDTGWSTPSSNNFVSILKLSPGKYTFRVKARGNNSVWSKPVLYSFMIRQPFWETWWFRTIAIICVLTAFYAFMRYRWQQKINLLEMRNRISQDLHDEIGGSISGINLLSQMASEKLQNNDLEEASAYLFKVKNYTQDVIEKLGDMVWIFNPQNDSIEKLLQRLNSFAVSIAASKNIKIHFETDKESETINLTIRERKVVYLISKEALNNTFKYAACSNIYYNLRAKASKWQLMIKDDGKGFMPSENKIGNGLKNMKARADEIGAKFSIQSQTGVGTIITVEF